jgi:hypothetical protein
LLNKYLTQTGNLLQNPTAPSALYDSTTLTSDINQARGQLAIESNSIRFIASIPTVLGQRNYNFSAINTGVSATNGIQGVVKVNSIRYAVASGYKWIRPRPWPWFDLFKLNNPVPTSGAPQVWAQHSQGVAGDFWLDPIPDLIYTLQLDCVCYPIDLANDATVEAIPYPWTDAVQYFAAYLALLSAQSGARSADANRSYERYEEFMGRARRFSTPEVNPYLYSQIPDPTMGNKLGVQPRQSSGGG